MEASPDYKALLNSYISDYNGISRYTRLLKLAESSPNPHISIEAVKLCLELSKS